MIRFFSAVLVTAALLVGLAPTNASANTDQIRDSTYHLALGDSLPYGFTTAKALAGLPPSAFTGYTDLVSAALRPHQRHFRTVNYSCPGETTTSFVTGTCPWKAAGFPLHDEYTGSQLPAAETFLHRYGRRPGLITVTLWGNDISQFLQSCPDLQCVVDRAPVEIAAFGDRLHRILTRLRAAAPNAPIVVVAAYHVQRVDIELGDQLIAAFNAAIGRAAAPVRATVADPVPAFNPVGDLTVRTDALCRLTLLCTENDTHPSPAGHEVIARLILEAPTSGEDPR